MRKKKIKKSEYQDLAECISSDQVPAEDIAEYFEDKKFKNCKYHNNLENAFYHPEDIPTHRLHKGWNYTDLRILEDFFDSHKMFYEESDNEKIKDILWEYISEKDIPEIEKRIKNEN